MDTISDMWASSKVGSQSDSSVVFSYPNEITLYISLHTYLWLIFELTIWEILYLNLLSIITDGKCYNLSSSIKTKKKPYIG